MPDERLLRHSEFRIGAFDLRQAELKPRLRPAPRNFARSAEPIFSANEIAAPARGAAREHHCRRMARSQRQRRTSPIFRLFEAPALQRHGPGQLMSCGIARRRLEEFPTESVGVGETPGAQRCKRLR
jgi:hypothetical protein